MSLTAITVIPAAQQTEMATPPAGACASSQAPMVYSDSSPVPPAQNA